MSNNYFTKLNYTLSNEDTYFEINLLPTNVNHVVSICGSGSRAIPLIAKGPKQLTIIDSSKLQIELCKLRVASIKALNHEEFLSFWGYKDIEEEERKKIFNLIELDSQSKELWNPIFEENKWKAPIYYGKWEKAIIKLSSIMQNLLGKKNIDRLFSFNDLIQYQTYLDNDFPWWRFNAFISILTHPFFMNVLLYKGHHAKFRHPEIKNMREYYISFFKTALRQDLAKNSFFLNLALRGKVFSAGMPAEANPEIFSKIKENLTGTQIIYREGDFFNNITSANPKIDFVSLSDVPSYFSKEIERDHLQMISQNLSEEAIVCCRYYMNCLSDINSNGFTNITADLNKEIAKEKTPFYRFDLWKKNTNSGT